MQEGRFIESKLGTQLLSALILFSVICFTIETLPGLSSNWINFLYWSELIVVGIFSIEYIYRCYVAKRTLSYMFSFEGLVDLLAVMPFYLMLAVDLRSIRVLRLLRLVRLLKLTRYNQSIIRLKAALIASKEELVLYMSATFILLYLAAFGIYHFEHAAQPEKFATMLDALWWAVITITTVGYGDDYPVTVGGRIFTFFILILGLGLVAVPAGIFASSLTSLKRKD